MTTLQGGRLVGNHLADLGHRHIAVIAGQPYASTGIDRTQGCLAALRERGIEVPATRVRHSEFDAQAGHLLATQMLAEDPEITAIFAVNDISAIGAMGALRDLGIRVGHDVAIVGFNDISITADLPTPLTSVRSPLNHMGQQAAGLLLEMLGHETAGPNRSPVEERLSPQLIVRESSDVSVDSRSLRGRSASVAAQNSPAGVTQHR